VKVTIEYDDQVEDFIEKINELLRERDLELSWEDSEGDASIEVKLTEKP